MDANQPGGGVTASTVAATVAGIGLIALALRDVFQVLFHPGERATVSPIVTRAVWRAFRRAARRRRALLPAAGPVALLCVIVTWATLLAVGWALLVWPHLDEAFRLPAGQHDTSAIDALYVSLVTLGTLGYGDITPTSDWLKLMLPLEALLGFGLLTASLSWLLAIYPALSRRRSLAYDISLLRRAEHDADLPLLELDAAGAQLGELTSRLVSVERDMTAYPIAYYFAETDERFSLAHAMPYLLDLAERGMAPSQPAATRLRATMLRDAIDDLAATTTGGRIAGTADALHAYARDHLHSGA